MIMEKEKFTTENNAFKSFVKEAGFNDNCDEAFILAIEKTKQLNNLDIDLKKNGVYVVNKKTNNKFRLIVSDKNKNEYFLFMPIEKYDFKKVNSKNIWHILYIKSKEKQWLIPENTPQLTVCKRCSGTGKHSFNLKNGTICFGCSGSGNNWTINGKKI